MGGPSAESKANEKSQMDFYKTATEQQKITFGQQQDLHKVVMDATVPILQKGPQQYGYTPEVDALLKSENIDSATQLAERQKAGGASVLPTGASAQLEENARILGEQSKARSLSQEKLSGYQAGSQLYGQALNALSGVTGRPTDYTSAATGAGQGATGAINLADSERSTLLSSLLTGAIQGGLTVATGGANKALGIPPCWVARAVYGEDSPLWLIFRDKFFDGRFPTLSALYLRFGERFAKFVKRSRVLKAVVKWLMDRVVYDKKD